MNGENADKKAVNRLLEDLGMHYRNINIEETVRHMIGEMNRGLAGKDSSLAMIPTYIQADTAIPSGRKTVVLDAGGTNLRAALVSFQASGSAEIESFVKTPMPGTAGSRVGKKEFFSTLAALVRPLLDRRAETSAEAAAGKIGFCFSYPVEIFPDRDGRLIHWSKEIQAPEVEGCFIGAELRSALKQTGMDSPPQVLILNDTVATLLAGKAAGMGRSWGGYGGYILGTGINSCYAELNSAIGKLSDSDSDPDTDKTQSQIVNCESGSYACRSRGQGDKSLGKATLNPNVYWLEKMVAGGYFGALVHHTLLLASQNGLFSAAVSKKLEQLDSISTKDADNYLHNPSGKENSLVGLVRQHGTEADACRIWFLTDSLLERAARLTAANLAAPVLKAGEGKGPLYPWCLTIDGTTYYRYYRFQSRVDGYLRPLLNGYNWYYDSLKVDDAPLIGAAAAALTN